MEPAGIVIIAVFVCLAAFVIIGKVKDKNKKEKM